MKSFIDTNTYILLSCKIHHELCLLSPQSSAVHGYPNCSRSTEHPVVLGFDPTAWAKWENTGLQGKLSLCYFSASRFLLEF